VVRTLGLSLVDESLCVEADEPEGCSRALADACVEHARIVS
jgi:hypothetical protein